MNRTRLKSLIALLLTAATAVTVSAADKPNIVFIMADDLGYGDLGCYGQQRIKTPNIDRMAAEGMRFTQYYSGSTVCAPSRCALMTGLHTGHSAVRDNDGGFGARPLGPSDVTVAEVLKQAGYTTVIIGKWDMAGPDVKGIPNQHGFDHSFGYLHSSRAHNHYPEHLWRDGQKVILEGNRNGQGTQYSHDMFTREALEYIERNQDRSFFLYLAYTLPHAELGVPEDSLKPYLGKFPEKPFGKPAPWQWKPGRYYPQENPKAAFAGMISRLDRDVGRLLTKLEQVGLDRDTLVIFTSDNGAHKEGGADPYFFGGGGPLRGLKRDLYEGGIRVPLIARWPGKIKSGSTTDHVSASWDILPTCAELAGVEITSADVPEEIDGLSMAPTLLGQPSQQETHEFLYWEFQEKQAVRMGDWKAVRIGGEDGGLELFNLKSDLGEQQDLSKRHPEIIARIKQIMKTSHNVPRN